MYKYFEKIINAYTKYINIKKIKDIHQSIVGLADFGCCFDSLLGFFSVFLGLPF